MTPFAERVIAMGAKAVLFTIPFIPLYIASPLFFPFITGKAFAFRILVEIAFSLWLFLAVFGAEYRPKKTPLLIAITAFVLVAAFATAFGVNPSRSFWSNFERMEGLITYLHLFAYFLAATHLFKRHDWSLVLNLFVVAGIFEGVYGLLQKVGVFASPQGGFRVDGTVGNPAYLAAYLIFIAGFSLLMLFRTSHRFLKYVYGAAAALSILVIYFTATRGAILALFAGAFVAASLLFFLVRRKDPAGRRTRIVAGSLLLGTILLLAAGVLLKRTPFVQQSPVLSRLTDISLSEKTIISRFAIWKMSTKGFLERPLLGWGPDNYTIVFSKYFDPSLWRQEPWFDRSHNVVFDWLINAGAFGFLAYFGMFGIALFTLWRRYARMRKENLEDRRKEFAPAILVTSLVVVYLLQNLFVFDQLATYISVFTLFAFVNAQDFRGEVRAGRGTSGASFLASPLGMGAIGGAMFALLVFCVYAVNIKPLRANAALLEALRLTSAGDARAAFERYKTALRYNTFGNQEIREQLGQFATLVVSAPQVDPAFKEEVMGTAIAEMERGVEKNPLDPRTRLFLGVLYNRAGVLDQALRAFQMARELAPTKQQVYFELADVYLKQGDNASALKVLQEAFNLDRSFDNARFNLAAVHILNREQDKADALLIEKFGTATPASYILAQVYGITNQYARRAEVLKELARIEPGNARLREELARTYITLRDRPNAIAALEEAVRIDPSLKEEAERLLRELGGR